MYQNNLLAQIIGLIAISLWTLSIQNKRQYKILFLQAVANLMYAIEYFLLGAISAASMNFISCIRCFLFSLKRKNNEDIPQFWLIFFLFSLLLLGILSFKDYLSLIPIVITIFYTIASYMKNSNWIRIVLLVAAFIWIYYNYVVGAYVGIIGNLLEIISGIVSLIRFRNIKKFRT